MPAPTPRALKHVDPPASVPPLPGAPPDPSVLASGRTTAGRQARTQTEDDALRHLAGLEASYAAIADVSDRLRAEFDEHTLDMLSR